MESRGLVIRLPAALAALALALPLVQGCALFSETEDAGTPSPPIEARGDDWPVLPREGGADEHDDPLEGVNQVFFYVNGALDFLLLEPIAQFYRGMMPTDARHAASRAFTNLAEPVVATNHLLQGEPDRAGITLGRFAVNSTAGVAGLFDVATDWGLEAVDADFGQTLHHYGIASGPYLVLPIFGSTTVRDAVGFGVDGLLDPRAYLLGPTPRLGLALGEGVVRREEAIEAVNFLRTYAADPYDAVRAWNYQQRQRELTGGCKEPRYVVCPSELLGEDD